MHLQLLRVILVGKIRGYDGLVAILISGDCRSYSIAVVILPGWILSWSSELLVVAVVPLGLNVVSGLVRLVWIGRLSLRIIDATGWDAQSVYQ